MSFKLHKDWNSSPPSVDSPKLPFELYGQILKILPLASLPRAALVCHDFQIESEVGIYRTIKITTPWIRQGGFHVLKQALLTAPRRQGLVQEIRYDSTSVEGIGPPFDGVWLETFHFFLSTLPNVKFIKIPQLNISDDNFDVWLGARSKFEVIHTLGIVFHSKRHVLDFWSTQVHIKELSTRIAIIPSESNIDLPDERDMAGLLPNLSSLSGYEPTIMSFVPGRPISKVKLACKPRPPLMHQAMFEGSFLPALQRSTASITHFRLTLFYFGANLLQIMVDGLPALELLHIIDFGDSRQMNSSLRMRTEDGNLPTLREHIMQLETRHDVAIPLETMEPINQKYPLFAPLVVDNFFGPLAQLKALRDFKFQYSNAPQTAAFTPFDLSPCLSWRDTTTPQLTSLQINHMTLVKVADSYWVQKATTEWMDAERSDPPFPLWED